MNPIKLGDAAVAAVGALGTYATTKYTASQMGDMYGTSSVVASASHGYATWSAGGLGVESTGGDALNVGVGLGVVGVGVAGGLLGMAMGHRAGLVGAGPGPKQESWFRRPVKRARSFGADGPLRTRNGNNQSVKDARKRLKRMRSKGLMQTPKADRIFRSVRSGARRATNAVHSNFTRGAGLVGLGGVAGFAAGMGLAMNAVDRLSQHILAADPIGIQPGSRGTSPTRRKRRASSTGAYVQRRAPVQGDLVLNLHKTGGRGAVRT